MQPSTNLEGAIEFKRLTGLTLRITPYDLVIAITVKSADEVVVTMQVHQIDERRTSVTLKAQGTRLTRYVRTAEGWHQAGLPFTMWQPDFEPVHHSIFGPGKTVAQWLAARRFESMCGRPGTDRHPLDSFQRTVIDGPDYSTRRMERHWA